MPPDQAALQVIRAICRNYERSQVSFRSRWDFARVFTFFPPLTVILFDILFASFVDFDEQIACQIVEFAE